MTMHPNTHGAPFCSPAQILWFYDANLLYQVFSDAGTPLLASAFLISPKVLAQLGAAAGDVESACAVAGRYSPADLAKLAEATGGAISNGGMKLLKLNADLAFAAGRQQRGYRTEMEFPQIGRAYELLEKLRLGERIFSFTEVEEAGVGSLQDQGNTVARRPPLATTLANRYFGTRGREYRIPPGGG